MGKDIRKEIKELENQVLEYNSEVARILFARERIQRKVNCLKRKLKKEKEKEMIK